MKSRLCNFESNDPNNFKKHYLDFHNVDRNNQFFIRLFKKKRLRCNNFIPSSRFEVNHDFLVHYDDGRNVFEEKLVNYTNFGEIQKY